MRKLAIEIPPEARKAVESVAQTVAAHPELSIFGATTAAALASKGYSTIKDMVLTKQTYQKMYDLFPNLKTQKPEMVKLYFNSLRSSNPTLARDPLVMGALLTNALTQNTLERPHFGIAAMVGEQAGIGKSLAEATKSRSELGKGPGRGSQFLAAAIQDMGRSYAADKARQDAKIRETLEYDPDYQAQVQGKAMLRNLAEARGAAKAKSLISPEEAREIEDFNREKAGKSRKPRFTQRMTY